MKTRALSLLSLLPLLACEQPRAITEPGPDLLAVIESQNQLALDVLAIAPEEGNLFLSPFSISNALGMTYAGAAGQTREEMRAVMHIPVDDAVFHAELGALGRDLAGEHHRPYTLMNANRLWGQEGMGWQQAMIDTCAEDYGAELANVDFSGNPDGARRDINQWVSRQTDGMIDEALWSGDVNAMTRLVLTNAIYFQADWSEAFEAENTAPATFTLADGGQVQVDMMSGSLPASVYSDEAVSVLSLPYEGEELSLLVILPAAADGLDALEASLSPSEIDGWVASMSSGDVDIELPRFTMRSRLSLADALAALGMPSAFDPDLADFSGMTDEAELYVADVIHEAVIELDEEGTRAAAFTGVTMGVNSAGPGLSFVADHPFLFAIRDDLTGTILFLGRMVDPSLTASQG